MKKELLLDNEGKIRHCPHNQAIMSIWQLVQQDHYWRGGFRQMASFWEGWDTSISVIVQIPLLIITFPVLPFLRAWVTRKDAREHIARRERMF